MLNEDIKERYKGGECGDGVHYRANKRVDVADGCIVVCVCECEEFSGRRSCYYPFANIKTA